MAEKIAIVTDSTSDLSVEEANQRGVFLVPLTVAFGEVEYLDQVELTSDRFYELLAASPHFPTTSQPPPGRFVELYQQLLREGYTHAIGLYISRKLSGTIQSASVAAQMVPELTVVSLDSKVTCSSLAQLVDYAQALVNQGARCGEVVGQVEALIPRLAIWFSVDSLNALERGGRIGRAKARLGNYLRIRPVLAFRDGRGEIDVVAKVRSQEAANRTMARLALAYARKFGVVSGITVVHSTQASFGQGLQDALRATGYDFKTIRQSRIGAVIGAHLGPTGWGLTLC